MNDVDLPTPLDHLHPQVDGFAAQNLHDCRGNGDPASSGKSPRRGCNLPNLYSFGGFEGAYGNVSGEGLADLGSMADIVVDLSGDKAPGQL